MQSGPAVPVSVSLPVVPRMMFVPAGQHDASSPRSVVTSCVRLVWLPAGSVAVQVTVVVPSGNWAGASFVTVTAPQSSVAVAVPSTRPAAAVQRVELVIAAGTDVNTGATLSPSTTCGVVRLPATSSPQSATAEHLPASVTLPLGAVRKLEVWVPVPWTMWTPATPEPGVGSVTLYVSFTLPVVVTDPVVAGSWVSILNT